MKTYEATLNQFEHAQNHVRVIQPYFKSGRIFRWNQKRRCL